MAFSNFVLTVVGIGAAVLLLKGDVKRTATTLRRNVRQMRVWLEEEEAAVKKSAVESARHHHRDTVFLSFFLEGLIQGGTGEAANSETGNVRKSVPQLQFMQCSVRQL
ncbi:unnamed protein product [Closterium sp. Yama58-4]|nr:unnamed protein product [Closterium sp. Yama58-4]